MRQYHDLEIVLTEELVKKGYVELETAQGYKVNIRFVKELPPKTDGVRIYATHSVLLTSSDIEEITKLDGKRTIMNKYAGQTQFVKYIPPRTNNDTVTKPNTKKK